MKVIVMSATAEQILYGNDQPNIIAKDTTCRIKPVSDSKIKRSITNKIDSITGIDEEQKQVAPPCPKSVKIELTARCNFNCAFCATGYKLRDKRDMEWDFYVKLLDQCKEAGVEEVGMFYLGESFMLPWLPKAIAEAKNKGFPYIFLTTNGSLSTPSKVKECMDAGLNSLKFSLNYADEKQFVEVARVKGRLYHKMLDNIKAAYEIREEGGYECGLFASYIRYDGEQGERMMEVLEDVKPYLDEVYALPLYSQADLTGAENQDRGWDVKAGNPGRADNMRAPLPCWAVFTEARVTHDGFLSACCFDHSRDFNMANLNEVSFMEGWHSQTFQRLRGAHLNMDVRGTACESCAAYN